MREASQLTGRGPTDVDVAPVLYLHGNQKSDDNLRVNYCPNIDHSCPSDYK